MSDYSFYLRIDRRFSLNCYYRQVMNLIRVSERTLGLAVPGDLIDSSDYGDDWTV